MTRVNNLLKFLFARRRLLVALAFVAFTGVLANGVVRLYDYTLPMLKGDYLAAATYNWPYNAPKGLYDPPPIPGLDPEESWQDQALLWAIDRYQRYADSAVGSRALAAYDYALGLYGEHKYEDAANALQKAFVSCCDKDGKVRPEYRLLASDIQLMIGNTFVDRKKFEDGIAAYENSLRLDPDNIVTTYNLEKLQDSKSGGGGQDKKDNKPQPGQPSPKTKI